MPEGLERVTVATRDGSVVIPWDSRDALLAQLRHIEACGSACEKFEAVGASRPVELDVVEQQLVADAIYVMAYAAGGLDYIPAGLEQLRDGLIAGEVDRDARG